MDTSEGLEEFKASYIEILKSTQYSKEKRIISLATDIIKLINDPDENKEEVDFFLKCFTWAINYEVNCEE